MKDNFTVCALDTPTPIWYNTAVINEKPVIEIKERAFHNCDKIKSLYIPATVTIIGSNIVGRCYKLDSITVQERDTFIFIYEVWTKFNREGGAKTTPILYGYKIEDGVTSSTGSWDIKYDVGILSSRFFMECKVNNVVINAKGHEIVNIFGHKCVDNEFTNMKIVAKSYKIIGCSSDSANADTEIKALPNGVLFTSN